MVSNTSIVFIVHYCIARKLTINSTDRQYLGESLCVSDLTMITSPSCNSFLTSFIRKNGREYFNEKICKIRKTLIVSTALSHQSSKYAMLARSSNTDR